MVNENTSKNLHLKVFFASGISFFLALLIIYLPSQMLVHGVASFFNIPTKFHRFQLIFPILDHSFLWTQLSVSSIYSATPLVALIAFLTARIIFFRKHITLSYSSSLLLIWLNALGIHFFFGALMVGIPLVKDFGYVPDWLYFPEWIRIFLVVFSALVLLLNGIVIRRQVETLMYSERQQQRPYYSFLFKWYAIYAPAIVFVFLFIVLGFPNNTLFMRLFWLMFLLQLIGVFPFKFIYAPLLHSEDTVKISGKYVILLVILLSMLILWRTIHLKLFPLPVGEYVLVYNPLERITI
ncbi:MAG: hypothetical protein WHT29_11135 [Bacteroidales bacterium]|nr:hypothetical protein [Bacteroidales bacterium]HOK98829.1 hypothetical protein [Bacteroidales bacterium]HPO65371.1 hypothetical protein [Bacteroidales bacterium]